MPVTEDRYTSTSSAPRPRPTAQRLAFVARGIASAQWWRKGSSHIDQSELWTVDRLAAPRVRTHDVTPLDGRAACGRCGAATDARSSTCRIAAAPRTSGRGRAARRGRATERSRRSRTDACCGRRSRATARRSRSSATSASGRVDTAAARRSAVPIVAPRRRDDAGARARCGRRISSAISRCRRTARRSRSSRAATCSRRPPRIPAMRRA